VRSKAGAVVQFLG